MRIRCTRPPASPRRRRHDEISGVHRTHSTAAPTGAGDSTRTASSAAVGSPRSYGRGSRERRARIYEGTIRHRRYAVRAARVHATGWRWPTSTSTSCPALLGGRLVAARPRPGALPPPPTTSATPRRRWTTRCATLVAQRTGAAPGGPVRVLTRTALVRALLQPGQLLLLLRRRRRARRRACRRGHQHTVGRAPRLRPARRGVRRSATGQRSPRHLHVSPFMAYGPATTTSGPPRRGQRCRCTSRAVITGHRRSTPRCACAAARSRAPRWPRRRHATRPPRCAYWR